MLLIPLFLSITVSCKTLSNDKVVLPPMPEREELPEIKTTQDLADIINYYEHLVQKWESWGENVNLLVGE